MKFTSLSQTCFLDKLLYFAEGFEALIIIKFYIMMVLEKSFIFITIESFEIECYDVLQIL